MYDNNLIPLPNLARELHALTGVQPPPYSQLSEAAASARFPVQQIGHRWFVCREDLSMVARALGLLEEDPVRV